MGPLDKRPLLCPGPSKGHQLVRGDPEQCGPPSQESWGPWLDLLPKQHTGAPELSPTRTEPRKELPWPRLALLCTCLDQEGSPLEMVTEWTPGPPQLLRFSAPATCIPPSHPDLPPLQMPKRRSSLPHLSSQGQSQRLEGLRLWLLQKAGSTFRRARERTRRPSSPPCPPRPGRKSQYVGPAAIGWGGKRSA